MFPNISHILYDLGNTLLYFEGDWDDVFRRAVSAAGKTGGRFGLDPDGQVALAERLAALLQDNYGRRETDLIEHPAGLVFFDALAGLGFPPEDRLPLEAVMAAFYSITQAHWLAIPGAADTLRRLEAQGYRQAVLSNAAHDADVQALVDKAGLRRHLDFVLTSAAIGRRKPDPEPFRRAAAAWEVAPEAVLMVGDTIGADIQGARAAGMVAIWARKYSDDVPGEIRPDAVIETVVDLPAVLKK